MLPWKPVCLFWLTLELVTQAWLPWAWFLLLGAWLFIMQTQVYQAEYYLVFNKVTLTRPWSPLICGAGPASLGDTTAQIEFLIIVTILRFNIQWLLCRVHAVCCLPLKQHRLDVKNSWSQSMGSRREQHSSSQHSTLAVHTMQDKAGQNQAQHVCTPKRSRTRDSMASKCPLLSRTPVEMVSLFNAPSPLELQWKWHHCSMPPPLWNSSGNGGHYSITCDSTPMGGARN